MQNKSFPLHYETHGNPNHPCIIFILGIGGQLIQWPEGLISGLVKNKFYVVTFDNRDSGLSQHFDHLGSSDIMSAILAKQKGEDVTSPYTFENMADDVLMLMDKLSIEKAHILGGSMGGMIAQIFALHHPERVLSLILISTTSGDQHLPPASQEVMQFFSLSVTNNSEKENLQSFVENKSKLYRIYNPHFFNEEKVRDLHTQVYQRAHKPEGFKRQLLALLAAEPRGEKLKQLQVRTLVIHGTDDAAFPLEHGKYLAECISGSTLEIIDKMGHAMADELCDKCVNVITNFINHKSNNSATIENND